MATVTLTGKNGTKYEFTIYSRSQTFKAIGVIYVMAKKTKTFDVIT
jgi:hypothetical protein